MWSLESPVSSTSLVSLYRCWLNVSLSVPTPHGRMKTLSRFTPHSILRLSLSLRLGLPQGPADTAEETNVAVGLLDFIFVPFFTLTFPIVGAILTFGIIILGLAFLLGHKRYSNHLTWAFTILGSFYIMLFNMNAATLHARFGLYAVTIATALMLVVAIDRTHGIGLVSNNRYPLPGTYSLDQPQPKAVISDLTVAKLLRKVFSELSISLPDWIDNRLPDEKSELKKARLRKPYAGVMTRKEAEKHRD